MNIKKTISYLFILFLFFSCTSLNKNDADMANKKGEKKTKMNNSKAIILDDFVGSECEGNFVWGVAMNFCWNELGKAILNADPILKTTNSEALTIIEKFNTFNLRKEILDEPSYFVKAGYGQSTVNSINKEVRKKFPQKSFSDLNLNLSDKDIISYAYFIKDLKFVHEFEEKTVKFMGESVKGFYTTDDKILETIKIIEYKNDNQFIIKLSLKNKGDNIFLAKGYDMNSPKFAINIINEKNGVFLNELDAYDKFYAPNINLDYHRDYSELVGLFLKNRNFEHYKIGQMFENIKFDINKKGARVENEAMMAVYATALPPAKPKKPRNFILNKPYWIIMKRADSKQPYFLLGVNNAKLMKKGKK